MFGHLADLWRGAAREPQWRWIVAEFLPAVALGAASLLFGWQFPPNTFASFLAALAVFSAFATTLNIFVFQLRGHWPGKTEDHEPDRLIMEHVDTLFRATTYAALLSMITTGLVAVGAALDENPELGVARAVITALACAAGVHMGAVIVYTIDSAAKAFDDLYIPDWWNDRRGEGS